MFDITPDDESQSKVSFEEQIVRELNMYECPRCDGDGFDKIVGKLCPLCKGLSVIPTASHGYVFSTSGQISLYSGQGEELRLLNDAKIDTLGVARKKMLFKLRKTATDLCVGITRLQGYDGGSMWRPIYAYVPVKVEQLIRTMADRLSLENRDLEVDPDFAREPEDGQETDDSTNVTNAIEVLGRMIEEKENVALSFFSPAELRALEDGPVILQRGVRSALKDYRDTVNDLSIPVLTWCAKQMSIEIV